MPSTPGQIEIFLVPKNLYHLNKLDGIYVKDAFSHRVVTEFLAW